MESAHDDRFVRELVFGLLLEVAHEESLDGALQRLVSRGVEVPGIAGVQVWLIEKGDLCVRCTRRPACSDQSHCLHLAAGKAKSVCGSGQNGRPFDDPNARIPFGWGLLGQAAATGRQHYHGDVQQHAGELPGFDWLKEARVVGCSVTPIQFKGEVIGLIVSFRDHDLPEDSLAWGRIFADHLGVVIAHGRAFDQNQQLKAQLELQNAYLQEEVLEAKAFGDLVGQSAALQQIVRQIELVAPTEAAVLIFGETGTGKELVAHEIHRRSRHPDGPLIRVNCASIPPGLFESEFFGHAKGAFTGAVKDRAGRFETAQGGTLFLDEVGEVRLEMQSKLLRVLQEKRYERVGEDRSRAVDVRIIGSTNRDLKQAVLAGRFREDLYYRLSVFPIQVPPLRERRDDIPLLAKHFVELSVRDLKCARPRLTRAGIVKLQRYDWPGNIRELRNVIERAIILARGGILEFDLPATRSVSRANWVPPQPETREGGATDSEFLTEAELQRRERDNLLVVLRKTKWKVKGTHGAAALLGVKPHTLRARMIRWGLKRPLA